MMVLSKLSPVPPTRPGCLLLLQPIFRSEVTGGAGHPAESFSRRFYSSVLERGQGRVSKCQGDEGGILTERL